MKVAAPVRRPGWSPTGWGAQTLAALHPAVRLDALYLRAKVFQGQRRHESMPCVAKTASAFCPQGPQCPPVEVDLKIACAVARRESNRTEEAESYLTDVTARCARHGFWTPLTNAVPVSGSLIERL